MLENGKMSVFEGKCWRFLILPEVQSLTVARIIDRFGRKRCQKKRNGAINTLLYVFFQKYFVTHEWWDLKNSFSTYVCTKGSYNCGVNCTG